MGSPMLFLSHVEELSRDAPEEAKKMVRIALYEMAGDMNRTAAKFGISRVRLNRMIARLGIRSEVKGWREKGRNRFRMPPRHKEGDHHVSS